MAQLSSYITAPYQGVSQAPPQARLSTQADMLEDAHCAIPQGQTKRPPFDYLGVLAGHPGDPSGLFERVERPGQDDVLFTLTNEAGVLKPRVYLLSTLALQAITVTTAAQAYLNQGGPTPVSDMAALTVEDYTFITNRLQTVGLNPTLAPSRPFEALVFVRLGAYAKSYHVNVQPVDGTLVTAYVHTPDGTDASDGTYVGTDVIVNALVTSGAYTGSNGGAVAGRLDALTTQGFTVTQIGPVIYLSHPTIDFTVATQDDQAGLAMEAIKDKVQSFADLPKKAVDGFTVRIVQQGGSDADDYFVKFVKTAADGTGVWEECIEPSSSQGYDPATLPVALTYNAGWKVDVNAWKPRSVGNTELAPDPDFVGSVVQDLTFWRGRLAIISAEGVTLSSADDPFRLYPKTLTTVLDSDPVSLFSPYPSRSILRYGVDFNTSLIVFGDIYQAVIASDGPVTPSSTSMKVLQTYEASPEARPQSSNGKVYFVAPHGTNWSTIYELKTQAYTNVTEAEDMTIAVPRYVPQGVDRVASCPVNYQIVYGKSGTTSMAVHLFRYAEQQRVQNAWERWYLRDGYVLGGAFFHNTQLYVVACKGGVSHLLRADTAPDLLDPDAASTILTCLDMRLTETQVTRTYQAGTDTTLVTLPYEAADTVIATVRAPAGVGGPSLTEDGPRAVPEGFQADVLSRSGNTMTLSGDWTQCAMFFGHSYTSRYRLSRFYAVGQDNQPLRSGRLSIRRIKVDVADTGYLRAEITAAGRTTRNYEFTGYRLDDPSSQFDVAPSVTAIFSFPVMTENEQLTVDLVNDSHFQHKVLGLEWRGELNQKAQRIA